MNGPAARNTRLKHLLTHLFALVALIGLVGCGAGNRAKVAGTVTIDGDALSEGLVTFRPTPDTPGPEFSCTITQGDFAGSDILPGNYAIEVRAWKKNGRIVKSPFGTDTDEIINAVPPRYHGPNTELKTHLDAGMNRVDLALAK